VHAAASRSLSKSITREQLAERAWSSQNNKSMPNHTQFSKPTPRHVPSASDKRIGARTGTGVSVGFDLGGAAGKAATSIPGTHAYPYAEHDHREWRCPRCLIMQRPTATACASCAKPRVQRAQPELLSKQLGAPR
jgi:hypothetical protein